MGRRIDVHPNTIARWERGESYPQTRSEVEHLADELLHSQEERTDLLKAADLRFEHWHPDYWNVPSQRNPFFVGRETLFHTLRQALVPGARAIALTDKAGRGTTQVAIEYAYRYGKDYNAILWIHADSQTTAISSFLYLATQILRLPEQREAIEQIAAVKQWLQQHHHWLLILDHIEDPHEILSICIPDIHHGSVLLTTRQHDVDTLIRREVLPQLSEEEATLLLLRRSGLLDKMASLPDPTSQEVIQAKDLCQLLDRHPLALNQAGAYIAEQHCSVQNYIDRYRLLLAQRITEIQFDRSKENDHTEAISFTFQISWEQFLKQYMLAGKLLAFCAFLAPDRIPEWLIHSAFLPLESNDTQKGVQMDNALEILSRYAFIERTHISPLQLTISMHRSLQKALRDLLSAEDQYWWMKHVIHKVTAVFPNGKRNAWSQCEILLPHALQCMSCLFLLKQNTHKGDQLLENVNRYLFTRGLYREAEPLLLQKISMHEKQFGTMHPTNVRFLNDLAVFYQKQGRFSEAEQLLLRALSIREKLLGPGVTSILNNLAILYKDQGRYTEAEPLYQRALSIREELLGPSHPETASSLNNLAVLYEKQGHYAEAEPLYQRALSIREELLGPSHPETASSLNNLAVLYEKQGHYAEAEPLYQQALSIRKELLGPSHPETTNSLNNLAMSYEDQGRFSEVESLYQQALSIHEELLGPSHPETTNSLNNLAMFYEDQGRFSEVESLYQRALSIRKELLSPSHPEVISILNHLAMLYKTQGCSPEEDLLPPRTTKQLSNTIEPK